MSENILGVIVLFCSISFLSGVEKINIIVSKIFTIIWVNKNTKHSGEQGK